MAPVAHYIVVPFEQAEDGFIAKEPIEAGCPSVPGSD
jgi:hypothetical protein